MKTTCDLCLQPQPLLWPGEKNLCPDCFQDTKDLPDCVISEFIAAGQITQKLVIQIAQLYSQLSEAETKVDDACSALADAEGDCHKISAQIAAIEKIAERKEMEVFA